MKTFLALTLAVLIAACSSKDNPITPVDPNDTTNHGTFTPYFTCTINDTPFVASKISFSVGYANSLITTPHGVTGYGMLGSDTISVSITSGKNGTGDVGFSEASFQFLNPSVPQYWKRDRATSGAFSVSDTTQHFTGTFSFTTIGAAHSSGNHVVTNGKFSLKK